MIIDAYAHVGMPRFQTVAGYRRQMIKNSISRAVLCSFDSSPDLWAIHSALVEEPDSFRCIGVPLGQDRKEMTASVTAQLAAGFTGIRLTEADIIERHWLLEPIADHHAIALVVGGSWSSTVAPRLIEHLDRHPESTIVGGHFAGVGNPDQLTSGPAAALMAQNGFKVIFSRHGGHPESTVQPWAESVVGILGWSRVMWGSESPVLFWRDETIDNALAWIRRLGPSDAELAAFHGGNAERVFFSGAPTARRLCMPFDPITRANIVPAGLFTKGLPVDQRLAGRLVDAWLNTGTENSFGEYVSGLLDHQLRPPTMRIQPAYSPMPSNEFDQKGTDS